MSDLTDERLAAVMEQTEQGAMHVRDIPDVHHALTELRRHRAMVKRLEAWEAELKTYVGSWPSVNVAVALRNRMRTP